MNVLVVGGAGYIGGAVTDLLASTGHRVRVFDALLYEDLYLKPVEFCRGDVRDPAALLPCLEQADAVVWLAAIVGDKACAADPGVTRAVNVAAVQRLAEHFNGRIVFLSTCSVYGARDGLLTEQAPTAPLSLYAETKLAAEASLRGKNALVFRLGTIYGVGDRFSRLRLDLVVNLLTMLAWTEGEITVFGGEQYRPLLHVRDAAAAILLALDVEAVGVMNLAAENLRILDLAARFRLHFPDLIVHRTEALFQDTRNYRASAARARSELGFAPTLGIDDGIEQVRALLEAGRIRDTADPRYRNHAFLALNPDRLGGPDVGHLVAS